MISDAVRACIKGAGRVSTDLQTIRWTEPGSGDRLQYLTPRDAQVALLRFDEGLTIEPFQFTLNRCLVIPRVERQIKEGVVHKVRRRSANILSDAKANLRVIQGIRPVPTAPLGGASRRFGLRALTSRALDRDITAG